MSTDATLRQAIDALRADDRTTARTLLHTFTEAQPSSPDGWLWLAAASDDPDQKRTYLARTLAINPSDHRAQAGLRALGVDPLALTLLSVPANAVVQPSKDDQAAQAKPVKAVHPLAMPSFAATGVRARRFVTWQVLALVMAIAVLIPLSLYAF